MADILNAIVAPIKKEMDKKDKRIAELEAQVLELQKSKYPKKSHEKFMKANHWKAEPLTIEEFIDKLEDICGLPGSGYMDCLVKVKETFDCEFHFRDRGDIVEAVKKSGDYYVYDDFDDLVEVVKESGDYIMFEDTHEIIDWVEENCSLSLRPNNY